VGKSARDRKKWKSIKEIGAKGNAFRISAERGKWKATRMAVKGQGGRKKGCQIETKEGG